MYLYVFFTINFYLCISTSASNEWGSKVVLYCILPSLGNQGYIDSSLFFVASEIHNVSVMSSCRNTVSLWQRSTRVQSSHVTSVASCSTTSRGCSQCSSTYHRILGMHTVYHPVPARTQRMRSTQ